MGTAISRKLYWSTVGGKFRIGNVYLFKQNNNSSYLCMWMIFKMVGNKQNMPPMWKKLMKNVDLHEPTSFLDHVYLGCTQRECKPYENIIEKDKEMFESRISAGANEKLSGWENSQAKTVAWSYDMEGHSQKCVERNCESTNKKTEQLYKVSSPCLDDHQITKGRA